jgi:aminoglycoside phosphotransferase (APT) family kinase protein
MAAETPVPAPHATGILDNPRLLSWLDQQGIGAGPVTAVRALSGGTQNIMLRFERAGRGYVLRRPPLHKRASSDAAMLREARVLAGLDGSRVPHPRLVASCPDPDVIGAAFYVVELPGVYRSPHAQRELGFAMVDALAELAAVDVAGAGLLTLGRPAGWLERQVGRWRAQIASYAEAGQWSVSWLGDIGTLADRLEASRPAEWRWSLMHGDYHFANVMVQRQRPAIAAIVDWELATLGDPLVDLGHLLCTWPDESGMATAATVLALPGLPRRSELAARYAGRSGRPVNDIGWYTAFACYRLAVLLEGTHARSIAGRAPREVGERLHVMAVSLVGQGLAHVR